jgi:hypothetical protein
LLFLQRPPADENRAAYVDSIIVLRERLSNLHQNVLARASEQFIRAASLSDIREAEFTVASTKATAGDVIVLTITNTAPNGSTRPLEIRIPVEDFGIVRKISAPVLLMHRRHVSGETEKIQVDAAKAAFLAGGSPTVAVPARSNFTPAAGTALTWTIHPRREGLWRWLQPGAGMNVSFTNFRTRTITFQKKGDTAESSEETTSDAVQVAAGPVITLFDGSLVLGAGWNLNVEKRRNYTAIGFNFLDILTNISERTKVPAK